MSSIDSQITQRFVKAMYELIGPGKEFKTKKAFADKMKIREQALTKIIANTGFVQFDSILRMHKQFKLNITWLFTGEGDMFLSKDPNNKLQDIERRLKSIEELIQGKVRK